MSAGLVKDATYTTVKQNLRNEIPVIDVTKSAPIKGSLAYNTSDNKLYFADGISWIEVTDSNTTGNTEFILATADPNYPNAKVLVGSANQINVLSGPGTVTLTTPQDIAPTSIVSFAGVTFQGCPGPLNYYEEAGIGPVMTGVSVPTSIPVIVVRTGIQVTISWQQKTVVADGTPMGFNMPPRFSPTSFGGSGTYISDDVTTASSQASVVTIDATGFVKFSNGITNFVAGHTITINNGSLSWVIG